MLLDTICSLGLNLTINNPFYLFPGLMFVLLVLCSILWDYLKDQLAINVIE